MYLVKTYEDARQMVARLRHEGLSAWMQRVQNDSYWSVDTPEGFERGWVVYECGGDPV